MDIRGYPDSPFNVEARIPAIKAPINAAAAGGREKRSMSSSLMVLETAPISPAAAASRTGLLNIMENPKTPQKPANKRSRIICHSARFRGRNGIGFSPSSMARIQAVIVATVIMIREYISRSIPERISSLARSIPLVINGKPGIMNSMEQI